MPSGQQPICENAPTKSRSSPRHNVHVSTHKTIEQISGLSLHASMSTCVTHHLPHVLRELNADVLLKPVVYLTEGVVINEKQSLPAVRKQATYSLQQSLVYVHLLNGESIHPKREQKVRETSEDSKAMCLLSRGGSERAWVRGCTAARAIILSCPI